jgi:hypothetical protein
VISQFTLYGLPMYQYNTPDEWSPSRLPGNATLSQTERVATPAGLTRIRREYMLQYEPPITTPEGSYYTLDGMVTGNEGEPVEPIFGARVEHAGAQAHGVVFAGGAYTVETATPVLQSLVTATLPSQPGVLDAGLAFTATDWYPLVFFNLQRVELARGDRETLVVVSGQFDPNRNAGNRRVYHALTFDVYHHDTSEDWTPPAIAYLHSALAQGQARIVVKAADTSGIQDVIVAHTAGDGIWLSTALVNDGGAWRGVFTATATAEFFVQVVDGAGNVTVQTYGDRYFHPGDRYLGAPDVYLPVAMRLD